MIFFRIHAKSKHNGVNVTIQVSFQTMFYCCKIALKQTEPHWWSGPLKVTANNLWVFVCNVCETDRQWDGGKEREGDREWCTLISLPSPQQQQINRSVKGSCAAGGWLTWLAPKDLHTRTHTHTHTHTHWHMHTFAFCCLHLCKYPRMHHVLAVSSTFSITAVKKKNYRTDCMTCKN